MSEKKRKNSEVTAAQARYIGARLALATQQEAAGAAGVTERTARAWEASPAVRRAMRAGVDLTLADAARKAAALQVSALDVLAAILEGDKTPGTLGLAAARAVLEHAPRLVEASDNAARLAEIETRLDDLDTSRNEGRNALKLA